MEIITALIIGFAGSFHCIGMCGPIALALPAAAASNYKFIIGRVLYNIGRVITYSFMGIFFGLLGGKIAMAGMQQILSILLGVTIIVYVVLPRRYKNYLTGAQLVQSMISPIKNQISKLFRLAGLPSLFLIGILNGFLPCGFVYIGLAGAAATGNPVTGALFMMMFGIGTIPAMFAASLFGKLISLNVRRKISKAIPALAVLLAIIFILRGLNLGIPYLSPKLQAQTQTEEVICH